MLLVLFLDRYHHLFYSLIPISYCDVESVTMTSEIDATKEVDKVDSDKVSWKTTLIILALTTFTLGVALFIGYKMVTGSSGSGAMGDWGNSARGFSDVIDMINNNSNYEKF